MKILAKITAILITLIVTPVLQAQVIPKPPKPPKIHHSEHSDKTSSSFSYSMSSSDDDGESKKTNVSVSISNSEDSYSLRAKFPSIKHQEIKDILNKEMSRKNHTSSKGKDIWSSDSNGEEVYKISLNDTKLSMYLDKDIASSSLAEKFEAMGLTIRTIIVGEQNQARRDAERLQRQADRLRRDAERMQREAQRIQREAQRYTKSGAKGYEDDVRKIANEAKRLASEASDLNLEAAHKGATSSVVRQLLGDSKTSYNENTKSNFNWSWPNAQNELLISFKKDNLINTENDVVFIKDATGIHVNGKHLSKNQVAKYNRILTKNNISKTHYFTFYKSNKHIVIVNDNSDLENFISDAISIEILKSTHKKVKLEINGNTTYKNGEQLSTSDLNKLNSVLLKNNIIPAPGKIFEIMKPGNYKLGYSIGNSRHLGSWYLKN